MDYKVTESPECAPSAPPPYTPPTGNIYAVTNHGFQAEADATYAPISSSGAPPRGRAYVQPPEGRAYVPPEGRAYIQPPAYTPQPVNVHLNAYPSQPQYGSGPTVVVTQPGVMVGGATYVTPAVPDNTFAMIFACAVAWCCCFVLGIIAFIYAVTAHDGSDVQEAYRKLRVSTRLSVAGLCTGIALCAALILLRVVMDALATE